MGTPACAPQDFRELVLGLAEEVGLPHDDVILGGDHLGPNRWRGMPAHEAMRHADELVEAYVAAGFTKIHLDCSFVCSGDPEPLTDELVATRSARLVQVAERCAGADADRLTYVIGTEVPVPGGAHHALEGVPPTSPRAARETLQAHRDAFDAAGMAHVWPRVAALVVQPGVEFDHQQVFAYQPEPARELSLVLDDEPSMVFEAHSTDYQTRDALGALVRDHWAVLKVGPQLTFALREALFGLASIEDELFPRSSGPTSRTWSSSACSPTLDSGRATTPGPRPSSVCSGATATATECVTTGLTRRSTRRRSVCWPTSPAWSSRCRC